jgi:hypothetical protein
MPNLEMLDTGIWIDILSPILIILCFYFTLTFFESLRNNDSRIAKQSKLVATLCIAFALLIPAIYKLYLYMLLH